MTVTYLTLADCDDDGEDAAGGKLAELLAFMKVNSYVASCRDFKDACTLYLHDTHCNLQPQTKTSSSW